MITTSIALNGEESISKVTNEIAKSLQYFDPKPIQRKGKKVYRSNPLQSDIRTSLIAAANVIHKKAQANAPYDMDTPSGKIHLRDSIKVRTAGNKRVNKYDDGIVAVSKVMTTGKAVGQYATVIEFGRDADALRAIGVLDSQPYMRPAMSGAEAAIKVFAQEYKTRWQKRAKQLDRRIRKKVKQYELSKR